MDSLVFSELHIVTTCNCLSTGKDKLNIKLNKYGQLMYGKKVSIFPLCLILMAMSSYKPNLNCLSSDCQERP
jgi:hypothetical protein